jgi:hypothetical protein
MYRLAQKDSTIDDVLNRCVDAENEGKSQYPGMSYEQGVRVGVEWLLGITDEPPFDGEEG